MEYITSAKRLIEQARQRGRLTQRELAERAGMSQPAIAKLERGTSNPTLDTPTGGAAAAGFDLRMELVPCARHRTPSCSDIKKTSTGRSCARTCARRWTGDFAPSVSGRRRGACFSAPRAVLAWQEMTQLERLLTALQRAGVDLIIVGGVAARAHGSSRLTDDLDVVYARDAGNLARVVKALAPLKPYLRGAPPGLPFEWSVATLRAGLNFTLTTRSGAIDLPRESSPAEAPTENLLPHALTIRIFGRDTHLLDLPWLIRVKRAAGRPGMTSR